ncbi:MAG TPA: hypothetical protein VFW98_02015 [Gemmatimonadaceae bacterium]|nr:hypothetical protein [Gemmatimonadaceae bacterium]
MPESITTRHSLVSAARAHARFIACLALAVLITACSADAPTAPGTHIATTPLASKGPGGGGDDGGSGGGGGGGGGGGSGSGSGSGGGTQTPVAQGPLAGVWAGEETWATGVAQWTVQVIQDSGSTTLSGSATTTLQLITSSNRTMAGTVLDSTHVTMNFITPGGKPGRTASARIETANFTLSPDGRTLSGPITPFEPGIVTTLTLRR